MQSRNAIIIALGQPSDPRPHDATMREMAEKVQALLPDWTVRGATQESPGSIASAASGMSSPVIYPLFLANGFFMAQVLPKRLAKLVPGATILPPFGADIALPAIVADILTEAARINGFAISETSILFAAHGSEMFPASRLSTQQLAGDVASRTGFKSFTFGFIEEHPFIEEAALNLGQAICLPLFALRASHVAVDVPTALQKADFSGIVLPPLGMNERVPRLIAKALRSTEQTAAA